MTGFVWFLLGLFIGANFGFLMFGLMRGLAIQGHVEG